MPLQKRRRAKAPTINAGSMADIAFLLLIFFLVTTKILEEKVLKVKLPPWSEENIIAGPTNAAILNIKLNAAGELLVEKERAKLFELKGLVKEFIERPVTDAGVLKAKGSGIISLQHEASTAYGKYIGVYDVLQLAYAEVHASEAAARFSMDWKVLDQKQRNAILSDLPIKISEAEPFNNN